MVLPSSGPIDLNSIQTEFGGVNHNINEYYREGIHVTENNTNVPHSGEIKFSDFYGAHKNNDLLEPPSESHTLPIFPGVFSYYGTSPVPSLYGAWSAVDIGSSSNISSSYNIDILSESGEFDINTGDSPNGSLNSHQHFLIHIKAPHKKLIVRGTISAGGYSDFTLELSIPANP